MKTKPILIIIVILTCACMGRAQNEKPFHIQGGKYRLITLCEWLNKEQKITISFNHNESALQKEVIVMTGEYSFSQLFTIYFQPNKLAYRQIGTQYIIYASGNERLLRHDGKVTISGYILDAESGERLQGATLSNNGTQGTISNQYGFYSLTIPKGEKELAVSFSGYDPQIQLLDLQNDTVIFYRLKNTSATLAPVIVSSTKKVAFQKSTQMSSVDLSIPMVESMPKFLGETDLFRALQFLPGVQAGSEINSGLYVRGGSPDQNLVLLDGVPVYNVNHLFGLFSVFTTSALQSVQLYKGGFPARFGGRLSSVVDIRMKEGNKSAFHGEGGISLISSYLTFEGPIKKDKSSFIVSARGANTGILNLFKSIKAHYDFYDLTAKTNFYLNEHNHLFLSGYWGRDKFRYKDTWESQNTDPLSQTEEVGLKWGNATAVARWNHQFNKKLFSNTTLNYSSYGYQFLSNNETTNLSTHEYFQYYLKQFTLLQDMSLKYDVDFIPGPNHFIRTGVSATRHFFNPGTAEDRIINLSFRRDTTLGSSQLANTEYDAYLEDDVQLSTRLKINAGLHFSGFKTEDKGYISLQPRLSARYLLTDRLSMKGAYVKMNQYLHLLTNSGIGLPTDLWVPVTKNIPPQSSEQFGLGLAYTTAKDIELSMETYYKKMNNVIEYKEGSSFTNTISNWDQRVEVGNGDSYGLELLAQKNKGRTTGLVSYTLSYSNRSFPSLNNGKPFPFHYDHRHDFKLVFNHKFSENKELSFDWVLSSGHALTLPVKTYRDIDGQDVTVYSERNAFRMPTYHRADISFSFHKQKRKFNRTWVISVYNVYNRANAFFIDLDEDKKQYRQNSVFPILPSVSYQIKF